jgi:hypothetical protein
MTIKPPLQKILQGILHTHLKGQAPPKYRKRKSKKVESNIDLGTYNQTFKQLRQLNHRNHHIPISTNT